MGFHKVLIAVDRDPHRGPRRRSWHSSGPFAAHPGGAAVAMITDRPSTADHWPASARKDDPDRDRGLSSSEAHARLRKFGPNAMPDADLGLFRLVLENFWAPIPWHVDR